MKRTVPRFDWGPQWAARCRAESGDATVAIVGLGQIGGSIGMAIMKRRMAKQVIGIDPDPRTCRSAVARRACHRTGPLETIRDADLVILAAPVRAIIRMAPRVRRLAKPGAMITDVGSTKCEIAAAFHGDRRFVPGHPMAGTERAGIEAADPNLFRGVHWVLGVRGKRALHPLEKIVLSLGASPEYVPASRHDQWVAFSSHLPYVLALVLARGRRALKDGQWLVAGSFRSATRVAAQPLAMGLDILMTNRFNIAREADTMARDLKKVAAQLRTGNETALRRLIKEGRP